MTDAMKQLVIITISLITACTAPTGLSDDVQVLDVERLDPPPAWFRIAYDQTVECLELENPLPFEPIRWFVAEAILINDRPEEYPWRGVAGIWHAPADIYMIRAHYIRQDTIIVRHELIHYLLQQWEHTEEFERCQNPNYVCERNQYGVEFCYWK